MGVHVVGMHLIGVNLIGMHLMGRASPTGELWIISLNDLCSKLPHTRIRLALIRSDMYYCNTGAHLAGQSAN
jgi:hypothetical protein